MPSFVVKGKVDKLALDRLLQAFSYGCTDKEACLHAGISESALYNYQKKHPNFKELKDKLKEYPVLYARQTLFDNIKGDKHICLKILEKLDKKYRQKQEVSLKDEAFESVLINLRKSNARDNQTDKQPKEPTDTTDTTGSDDDPEPLGGR